MRRGGDPLKNDMHWFLQAIVFSNLLIWHANAFNADIASIRTFNLGSSTSKDDYFGYSLALHSNDQGKWLLVGAPLSNEGSTSRTGNLYKCPLSTTGGCTRMAIDIDGPEEDRSLQWLGANVYSGGPKKNVVTCAPRFRDVPPGKVWLHGRCILMEGVNFGVRERINPCREAAQGNKNYGYCQVGMSATITGDGGPFLAMGLPGYKQTTGQLGLINIDKLQPSGQDPFLTTSIDRLGYGDAMGYSVSWGNFSGQGLGDIVGGAPTGSDLKGKVIVYSLTGSLDFKGILENPERQTGSYFGATVSAIDLNNDGLSDLLVGAPLYSVDQEEGKVYVFMNNGQGALNLLSSHLMPDKRGGARFGSSIAPLGDINGDGYQDFVVGAPFGGSDGRGAVYIYHGGPNGLKNGFKPIQTINAADVPGTHKGFGIAVTGGLDIDNNGYPDFAVGSYLSEEAQVIKSRGVLKMSGTIKLNVTKIAVTTNASYCSGPDGKSYTCVQMETCLNYIGEGVPLTVDANVQLLLDDAQSGEKRAFFFSSAGRLTQLTFQTQLTKGTPKCSSRVIYTATSNVKDFLSPIQVNMQYSYVTPSSCSPSLCPVMDQYLGSSTSQQLFYLKGCGSDDICDSDLVLEATYSFPGDSKELLFGVADSFVITATVENKKENAYLAQLLIDYPPDFTPVGAKATDGSTVLWDSDTSANRVTISLASPFETGKKTVIEAKFAPARPRPSTVKQKFVVKTTTISNDVNANNNVITLTVNAALLADITIAGSAFPDSIFLSKGPPKDNKDVKTIQDIGPVVNYTFLVQNKGPSPVEKLDVLVQITTSEKSNNLLYLLGAEIDGTVACNANTNPANLTSSGGSQTNETTPNRRRRSVDRLGCRTVVCTAFTCKIGRLQKGQSVTLRIYTRLWEHTLKKRGEGSVELIVKSTIEVPKEELEFLRQPADGEPDSKEVVLRVNPPADTKTSEKSSIPWWIILLAVLGGLLLLAIPTVIMYKRGFFKRDRRIKEITGPSGGAADVE